MPRRLSLIVFVLMMVTAAWAAGPRTLTIPGPDKAALGAEDALALAAGGPERFAWPFDCALTATDGEGWDRLTDGSHRWRLLVRAPGAWSLGFGFARFDLPWGASMRITGERGPERVFTAADEQPHGQLWTPVVLGDEALITLTLPPGSRDQFDLELARVGRGYRVFGGPVAEKIGDCNIDVVCPEGDDWRQEIRSVAVYTLGAIWKCTGAMINNTAIDETPYFLTANHCGVDANDAATVTVYWNFESATCEDLGGGDLSDAQSGAIWRASYTPSDMTLLELSAKPDTSWHVTYAGWDRSGGAMSGAVTIHHPRTDVKCISFEDDPLTVTGYTSNAVPGDGTHWRVTDWDRGTTEPGSSGCPLFTLAGRIVGQLHGGFAACGNDESDWYGRMSVSWTGGGTASTQLGPWLDPRGTGVVTLGTHDPLDPSIPPPLPTKVALRVVNPASVNGPVEVFFELPRNGHVRLTAYDLRGRRVAVLADRQYGGSSWSVDWHATGVASGVYVLRLEALGEEHRTQVTLVR